MNRKLLSICIWTYNDRDTLFDNIYNLLSISDNRFQIIVQDNASTDGTLKKAVDIKDPRFIYRRNSTNIGPLPNALKSLTDINSEFGMALVARDILNASELPAFINFLEMHDVDMGRIELNENRNNRNIHVYAPGIDSYKQLAYKNCHPSGYFWKEGIINEGLKEITKLNVDKHFDFPFELIFGYACSKYTGAVYNYPLIIPQYENFRKVKKTSSYNSRNYFFLPAKRKEAFIYYTNQVDSLDIDNNLRSQIKFDLYKIFLYNFSLGYYNFIAKEDNRFHYKISGERPSKKIMIKSIVFEFFRNKIDFRRMIYMCRLCLIALIKK